MHFTLSPGVRIAAALSALSIASLAQAVTVSSLSSTPVLIGAVVAGQSYTVVATGTSNLLNGFNGGAGLTFTADGKPTYAFPAPYAAFFPNGLYYDPTVGPDSVGPGGAGRLLGSLLGTFSAAPAMPTDYVVLGLSSSFVAMTTGNLYGLVNDTFYGDNASTGFSVTMVPEPGTWLLMLGGLCAVAGGWRQRSQG